MGNVLVDLCSIEDALVSYGRALALAPSSSAIFSGLLFNTHYLARPDPVRTFALHRQFGDMMRATIALGGARAAPVWNPGRRLRVGYMSPNFSRHSVGYFAEPVIRHHDRNRFEVYCYYMHPLSDETTERFRQLADGWRHIAEAPDDAIEQLIRDDGIDILVDLAGHSKLNRLAVFARKPAPIQMTWLGYPNTTGLEAIDYRVTDWVADPYGDAERRHTERLLRIDDAFLCYQPPNDSPPVCSRSAACIVFASFNNVSKLNEPMIKVWGQILAQVPESRLILKSARLDCQDIVNRVLNCFERNNIELGRIELKGWVPDRSHHLDHYGEIDIALDTFPYNGTTTTCEALWMGVPVVSLAGAVHMSRVGASILRCAGLDEFVAANADEYIATAVALAHDRDRRQALRANLRSRIMTSPLLDHEGFTRKLERQFRQCWIAECARQARG
jgi:predicted O-linked N-acetylglucosamine transferase (SPINDLY family)